MCWNRASSRNYSVTKDDWVAITRSDLIAVGDSADDVIRKSADKGVSEPIVYFVPRDGNTGMYY